MDRDPKRAKREHGVDVVAAAMSRLEEGHGGAQVEGFMPSKAFQGARPGYVFTRGQAGQGYYPDKYYVADAVQTREPARKKVVKSADQLLEEAEKEHQEEADAQVEVLDVRGMKKLVLSFEKSLRGNLEARMRFAETPDKFVESELDLDEEIRKLHSLATAPKLYPELVRLNLIPSMLSLLSHENPDIAADAIEVLHELTDGDVVEDSEEEAQTLVDALVENNALEVLVQGLSRFDEKNPDEASAVFNTLGILENMMEVRKETGEQALARTKLLRWLLGRVKAREFDSNKFSAAELLSILMQGSEANQKRLGATNGVDSLLQAVAMYKGREPNTQDEEEMVANLFDALCWVVMSGDNKEKFVQAEGIELMLLVIKNKKYARLSAIKALDFALTRCPAGCERFVDVLGLKSVFAAFMGKIKATGKRKLTPEEKLDEEQRSVSLLASLFMGLPRGSRKDRLGAKFVENEFEKVDRLMEILMTYHAAVAQAEAKFKAELDGEEMDEEDEEDLQTARLDAGLFTLQMAALILAHVWAFKHSGIRARVELLLTQNGLELAQVRELLQEHCDTIGDNDGAEEREKRQKRIQKQIDMMYIDSELPPEEEGAADAAAAGEGGEEDAEGAEGAAGENGAPAGAVNGAVAAEEGSKKEKKEHMSKGKSRKDAVDAADLDIDWDMEKRDD